MGSQNGHQALHISSHQPTRRLHSAIGYVTQMYKLEGRENKIFQQRDKKLEEAREKRSRKNKIKIAA